MDSRVEIVCRYLDAFATADPDTIAGLVTDDFVNEHLGELGSGCVGREEYRRRLTGFLAMFPGLRYTVGAVGALDLDGQAVAGYRMFAEYEGIPIDIPGVMWFDIREGLIARRTDLWDSLTFLRQTGQAD